MKWRSLIAFLAKARRTDGRENDEDRDPTVRMLQGGLIVTLFLWGVLALAIYADVIAKIFGEYGNAITALGTVAVAVFTGTLWLTTSRTLAVMKRQADQLDVEFVATHRPNLILRGVGYHELSGPAAVSPVAVVKFFIANNGSSDAMIVEAHATLWPHFVGAPRPAIPPYTDDMEDVLGGVTIRDGQSIPYTFTPGNQREVLDRVQLLKVADADSAFGLRLIGYVVYVDAAKDEDQGRYRMAFCRDYDRLSGRFIPEADPDPDYEYQPYQA